MPGSLRVEFVKLGEGGYGENILKDIVPVAASGAGPSPATPATLTLTTAGLAQNVSPLPPSGRAGTVYARLTAIGGPVHIAKNAVATLTNGMRLATEIPEVIAMKPGDWISARQES